MIFVTWSGVRVPSSPLTDKHVYLTCSALLVVLKQYFREIRKGITVEISGAPDMEDGSIPSVPLDLFASLFKGSGSWLFQLLSF